MSELLDDIIKDGRSANRESAIVGAGEKSKASSYFFDSNDLALTACPSKTSVCGPRNVLLENTFTVPIKMSISDFDGLTDSCHWMIKTECGLPSIEITKMSKSLEGEFGLHYVEWQADGPDVQLDLEFEDYPKFVSKTEYVKGQFDYPEGELGELVYDVTNYPKGISFEEQAEFTKYHKYVWASVIESEVQRIKINRQNYDKKLKNWEMMASEYNEQVGDIENLIESLDNQGWVHQIQAGL